MSNFELFVEDLQLVFVFVLPMLSGYLHAVGRKESIS